MMWNSSTLWPRAQTIIASTSEEPFKETFRPLDSILINHTVLPTQLLCRTITLTRESLRKPSFSRSVPMKEPVAAEANSNREVLQWSMSPPRTHSKLCPWNRLTWCISSGFEYKWIPSLSLPALYFLLLEMIENISEPFEHKEFNCKIMTKGVESVHDEKCGGVLSSLFSCLPYLLFLPAKSLHSLYQSVSIFLFPIHKQQWTVGVL